VNRFAITFTNRDTTKARLVVIDATICHIIRDKRLLLKMANSGISMGKWNGPGGKIEPGETPEQNVIREVMEETGLRIIDPAYHGKIEFYMNGNDKLDYLVHIFSSKRFSGRARSSEEGKVRWFDLAKLPYARMWDDDRYWLPLLLNGATFDARFCYDKENKHVVDYEINSRSTI
jgi:8-oxo-dGTP diphosphatase